jgi:large subunit ribosomal protein L32e
MKKPFDSVTENTLKLREHVKKNKPKFVRQESWRYKRLKENWRRPRGLDNKMRRKIKGWPPTVNAGYRGPKVSRGLHPSGYREVLVYNLTELKGIDPKTKAVKIAHTVSNRKRAKILTEARKKKITILNLKEVKEVVKKEEEELEEEEENEVKEELKTEKSKPMKTKGEQKNNGGS